ncbi:MAG: hypothetical protein ACRD3T_13415 [Terriglobia bacterium]
MKHAKLISMIRRGADVVWTTVRMLLLPAVLLGWAVDDTMKTLAAALVFATAPEASRKHRSAPAAFEE